MDEKIKFNPNWIKEEFNEQTIQFAMVKGKNFANNGKGLTTSQIRSFFGELRRIQLNGFEEEYSSFLLLEPKLAYAVKRRTNKQGKKELEEFYKDFKDFKNAIELNEKTKRKKQFENLVKLIEAIIAYHKYFNGQDN